MISATVYYIISARAKNHSSSEDLYSLVKKKKKKSFSSNDYFSLNHPSVAVPPENGEKNINGCAVPSKKKKIKNQDNI